MLTLDMMNRLWPHADRYVPGLNEGIAKAAPIVFPKYGLTTDIAIAQFIAEATEECGSGAEMQENMNYTAARLLQVFPTHFTHAEALTCQHNPRMIADRAYGGRMGNAPPPSDDGWNYRGKGLSQVTGKSSYAALAKKTGLDVLGHPEFLLAPDTTLECGVADFVICGCLPYALRDNLIGVASMLNVGHYVSDPSRINGFQMRQHALALTKHVMGI